MLHKLLRRLASSEKSRGVASKPQLGYESLEERRLMAVRVWDGGAISNNWTNPDNWSANIAPTAGDDLVFPAGVSDKVADNNFAADTFFRSISVAGGYELRGARVMLGSGGIIGNGSSNIIRHEVNLGAAGSGNRVFQINAGSTLFMNDRIVGSNGLNKTGGGDLSLRNNNTYSGVTDILAGRLFIERDEALGSFSSNARTIIRGGAQLVLNDNLPASVLRVDEPITVDNGGSLRALNDVHLRGNLVTNGTATLQHDGSDIERMRVTGQISGAGGITIANGSGFILLDGPVGNTFQGLTNVQGLLILNHVGDNSIPGNLTIGNTGRLRMLGPNQISDAATVTVNGGGFLDTDGFDETVNSLVMQGGLISGNHINLVDAFVDGITALFPPTTRIFDFAKSFYPFNNANWQVNQLVATSDSTGRAAQLVDLNLNLTSTLGQLQVNDGVGATDFLVNSRLSSNGTVLTFGGTGTTVMQDKPLEDYVVNAGHLNLAQFRRGDVLFDYSQVDVTVNAGGKFSSDATIKSLAVNAGGRVHPGPLNFDLTTLPEFAELLRGTSLNPGTMSITGNLTMAAGSNMEIQLNGAIAGAQHEQIDVQGAVQLDGALIEAMMGGNVSAGQNYRVINNGGNDQISGFISIPPNSAGLLTATGGQKLAVNHSGGTLNNDLVLTLQNTPPMAPNLRLDKTRINEGGVVTATGGLVDPDRQDRLRLIIDWGDGTRQTVRPGRDQFSYSHRYRQDGVYTARFVWLDQNNQGNSRSFQVQVDNVVPELQWYVKRQRNGRVVLAGWVNDPGNDRLTLTVDYGDGSGLLQRSMGRNGQFTLGHRFQQPGTYLMTVTVTDANGARSVLQKSVTV